MSTEYLKLSDSAQQRAKMYMSIGEPARAYEAYREAAEHMLQFSKQAQGKMRADAEQITMQLINKARQAKAAAEGTPAVQAPSASAAEPKEVKPAATPAKPKDNNSSIASDIKSFQRGAGSTMVCVSSCRVSACKPLSAAVRSCSDQSVRS